MSLATRLKIRRKELGLSQTALAAACGVSQPTIANWETGGHIPRQAMLSAVSEHLNIDPVWLMTGEQPAHKSPVHAHMLCPIRHIAVYDWPAKIKDMDKKPPREYLSLNLWESNIFALNGAKTGGDHRATLYIFDREAALFSGTYLVERGGKPVMMALAEMTPADKSIARLIRSLKRY